MSNILFTGNKNYMKRHSSSGTDTMLGPNTLRYFGSYYTNDYEVTHDLGRPPLFRVFYEPFQDGKVFEAFQDISYNLANPPNTYGGAAAGPTCFAWTDNTKLYIRLFYTTTALSAVSFPIHWVVYADYGAEA